jgi:hypothetical protein
MRIKKYTQFITENKNNDRLESIIKKFPQANVEELKELFGSMDTQEQEDFLNELEGVSLSNIEDKVEDISSEVNESINESNAKVILAGIALLLGSTFGQAQTSQLPTKDKIEQSINQELSNLPKSGTTIKSGDWKEVGKKTHTTKTIQGIEKDTLVTTWKRKFEKTDTIKTVAVEYNEDFVMSPPKGVEGSDSYELATTVNNIHDMIQNLQDGQEIDWSKLQTTEKGDSVITWAGKGDNHMVVKMFLKKTFSDTDNIAIGDIYGYKDGKSWSVDENGNPVGLEVIAKKGEKVPVGTVGYFLLGQWNVVTQESITTETISKIDEWDTISTIAHKDWSPKGSKGSGTKAKPYKGKCVSGYNK